jgi:glutathione peroxidase-family protein
MEPWTFDGTSVRNSTHVPAFVVPCTSRLELTVSSSLFYAAKFLVDHEGVPYKRFSPKTPPFDLKGDIEALLKKKEAS